MDLGAPQHISELNSAIAFLTLKNVIALFSSEMCGGASKRSKSTSHPKTMMCVRSDGAVSTRSVGAVSSHLEGHACSAGSFTSMSSVVRSADSLLISSWNIFSSEVSVRYCGRSDVAVSKAFSPAIATDAGSKADADHELKTSFDAIFGHACSAGSVLMIGIED